MLNFFLQVSDLGSFLMPLFSASFIYLDSSCFSNSWRSSRSESPWITSSRSSTLLWPKMSLWLFVYLSSSSCWCKGEKEERDLRSALSSPPSESESEQELTPEDASVPSLLAPFASTPAYSAFLFLSLFLACPPSRWICSTSASSFFRCNSLFDFLLLRSRKPSSTRSACA